MATAPHIRSTEFTDPEIERSKVFVPSKNVNNSSVLVGINKEQQRNPQDAIQRFQEEKSYGLGRRRVRRTRKSKKSRKIRKTRKH